MRTRARVGVAAFGVVLGLALWIDFSTMLALHVWGGVPRQVMLFGEAVGILLIPYSLWRAFGPKHLHVNVHLRHRH